MRIDDFPKRVWPERPKTDDDPAIANAASQGVAESDVVEAALRILSAHVGGRQVHATAAAKIETAAERLAE